MAAAVAPNGSEMNIDARWVRVTGTRGRFVMFEFTVADPCLTVELILPHAAFAEFCVANNAQLTIEPQAAAGYFRLAELASPNPAA